MDSLLACHTRFSTGVWAIKKNHWKPILLFVKGKNRNEYVTDVVTPKLGGRDLRFHRQGLDVGGFVDLVKGFTAKGDLVCDPFCGGRHDRSRHVCLRNESLGRNRYRWSMYRRDGEETTKDVSRNARNRKRLKQSCRAAADQRLDGNYNSDH